MSTRPNSADVIATGFVTDAFETELDEAAVTGLAETVANFVETLRDRG